MKTKYTTRNSEFIVDSEAKTIRRVHEGENSRWNDNRDVPYEFLQRSVDGGLYVHAIDPDTGTLRPFQTSRVVRVENERVFQ